MAEIPTSEPVAFFQGDTVKWTKALPDYRASDGWSLQYALSGPSGGVTISAVASGDDFLVTLAAADTLAIQPGDFKLTGFVSKAGERLTVFEGRVTVSANPLRVLHSELTGRINICFIRVIRGIRGQNLPVKHGDITKEIIGRPWRS